MVPVRLHSAATVVPPVCDRRPLGGKQCLSSLKPLRDRRDCLSCGAGGSYEKGSYVGGATRRARARTLTPGATGKNRGFGRSRSRGGPEGDARLSRRGNCAHC